MSERFKKLKGALQGPRTRVAGSIVDEGKDTVSVKMAGYLLEIPRDSILDQEKAGEGAVVLNLKRDAEILMTSVTPVEEMIGALSKKIVIGQINDDTECCDCIECSYCSDCTECSYCTDWGRPLRARVLPPLTRISRFRAF